MIEIIGNESDGYSWRLSPDEAWLSGYSTYQSAWDAAYGTLLNRGEKLTSWPQIGDEYTRSDTGVRYRYGNSGWQPLRHYILR